MDDMSLKDRWICLRLINLGLVSINIWKKLVWRKNWLLAYFLGTLNKLFLKYIHRITKPGIQHSINGRRIGYLIVTTPIVWYSTYISKN